MMVRQVQPDLRAPLPTPLDEPLWDELTAFVVTERITGILAHAIAGGLPVTGRQQQHAQSLHHAAVVTDLRVERALLTLAEQLDAAGSRWRVIKGVAAARQLHRTPEVRSTGDVDVLVHPADYPQALEAIRTGGDVAQDYPAHGPASARQAGGHTFVTASGIELDVHRAVRGPLARFAIPTDILFSEAASIEVQGKQLQIPPVPVVVLHAMLHLAKDGGKPGSSARLSTLADLMVARVRCEPTYRHAHELAARCGCSVPAAWADEVVRGWLGHAAPVSRAAPQAAVLTYDRVLARSGLVSALRRFEGPRRLRRSWEALLPSDEFRERHGMSRSGQLRYVAQRLGAADRRRAPRRRSG
jgi:hypothetical protein